jgi:hypothetical protein
LRYSNRVKVPKPIQPGRDVLHHGRLGLDGRAAQGHRQALLHPAVPVPDPRLRQDRGGLHPPPHAAAEVDEDEFFHSRESGGTVVSSALHLLHKILHERYASGDWNVYVAQASDGDNWDNDSVQCRQMLTKPSCPRCSTTPMSKSPTARRRTCGRIRAGAGPSPHFAMQKIESPADIYPVFRELFKKQPK